MHPEILNTEQTTLLPYLELFSRSFFLVGGTAIALHIGHRRSIDFDLFTASSSINKKFIKEKLSSIPFNKQLLFEDVDQYHLLLHHVKFTFFSYPFPIQHAIKLKSIISMPDLLSLAAMKAYALGRRSKWKDYVDLYFIIKSHYSISEIADKAKQYYSDQFSEKLFRQQLTYHKDIDYQESVEYITTPVEEDEIKSFLIEKSTDIF
jgi:hypothetical protein